VVEPGGEAAVHDLLPDAGGMIRSVGFRMPEEGLTCVLGIGSDAWDRLFAGPRPAHLHPFREVTGERHHAPATPGDLFLHIRARCTYPCFELARRIVAAFGPAARVADEVQGFRYFDERDLIGFVDGTESPGGKAGTAATIVTADDDPDFAGGSYVIVQKYLHDMDAWNALSVEEQERVIGRSKLDDIEMPDEIKPANSHVALNTITGPDGEERQIVRNNMPFGNPGRGEFGTYYIGYAKTPSVTEEMLVNMFIGKPPGNTDRILDFSTAITGTLFFSPSADFLDDPPGPPGPPGAAEADSAADVPEASAYRSADDGSLGIGSLKR
jgi:putative iron-dependent peroxidase